MGGLGLGLALVRHITELHGGSASAESPGLGRGATFTITLPIRASVPAARDARQLSEREPPEESAAADPIRGLRVLVVDDEPDACELTAMVLAQAGARVQTACSAAEGFQAFRHFRPDVLVSDIGMPEADGYSLIRRIRALEQREGGRVAALALTAFAQEEDRARALAAGFSTHMRKPVEPGVLASAVASLSAPQQR
jgi:CheY-like chemotaxis protein